jgi:excisionase family DNA binding protein
MDTVVPLTFTAEEVGALLRVGRKTVHRWMDSQKLPSFRVSRTRRCTKESLEKLIGAKIELSHLLAAIGKAGGPRAPVTAGARKNMSVAAKARHARKAAKV